MECWPPASEERVKLAMPFWSDAAESVVVPSSRVTVPVGVVPALLAVAVKVMDWPTVEGLRLMKAWTV